MEEITQEVQQEKKVLEQMKTISAGMTGWLKFLGIMMIIAGAISALSIVGIIVAWIPIWLGVLLLQAGNRATNAQLTDNPQELIMMMDKLRLFFIILGVLIIVEIAFVVIGFFAFGSFVSSIMQNMNMPQF